MEAMKPPKPEDEYDEEEKEEEKNEFQILVRPMINSPTITT